MKLLIIISIVACTYADKLDRTYLPPANAGSAGGSPGSLIAPGVQPGLSSGPSGSVNFGARAPLNLNQNGQKFGSAGFNIPSGSSNFDSSNVGLNVLPSGQQPGYAGNSAFNQGLQDKPGQGQQLGFGTSGSASQGNGFDSSKGASFGPAPSTSNGLGSSQGFGQPIGSQPSSFNQGFGSGQLNAYAAPQPERPQASADRNAEILKYINENDGESYNYSYETSNGISAEESGVATNGVRAQGGYAYTGDDGYQYSVTYTADENGYQPQGEHLPTPHPIPEEILKSIEENAKAAASGTQEGAYRPEEYESEDSLQQYNAGVSAYNQPQGQGLGVGINQPQGNSIIGSQSISGQGYTGRLQGQEQPNQISNQFSSGQNGFKGQGNQFQQRFEGQNQVQQGQRQGFSGQNDGQMAQGAQNNGYQYNQPQNGIGSSSQTAQRPSTQNRPQLAPQRPSSYAPSLSQDFGSNGQGISGLSSKRPSDGSNFPGNQNQRPSTQNRPQLAPQRPSSYAPGLSQDFGSNGQGISGLSSKRPSDGSNFPGNQNQPSFDKSRPSYQQSGGQGSISAQGQQPSFGSNQDVSGSPGISKPGQQFSSESSRPSTGGIAKQGQQGPFGSTQPSFGSTQSSFRPQQQSVNSDQGYQYGLNANQPSFGSNNEIRQGSQPFGNKPSGNGGPNQSISLASGVQNGYSGAGARPQYQQTGNQPSFGSNSFGQGAQSGANGFAPSAGPSGSRGPQSGQQSQYQPGQQPSSSPNGKPSQAGAGSQFGGPRQPPSFSPQEGYKY